MSWYDPDLDEIQARRAGFAIGRLTLVIFFCILWFIALDALGGPS